MVAQSGGMGFAFFDRGRPKNLAFRYIVTTGNEACVDVCDFLDAMLDEGKTDVFLLLVEDIKSPDKFRRVAAKALRAGKPLIVGKIGQSEAGSRAAASHTGALAGSAAAYRAIFERYGVIEGRDLDDMVDLAMAFTTCARLLPAGKRVGICTSSGGGGVVGRGCVRGGGPHRAGARCGDARSDRRALAALRYVAEPGRRHGARSVHHVDYAEFARLLDHSPEIDGIIMVITARATRFIAGDRARLEKFAGEATKPVLMWSYTLPTERNAEILSGAGYPLFTSLQNCARAMALLMAGFRAARERHLAAVECRATAPAVRLAAAAALDAGGADLCRPGGAARGCRLRHRRRQCGRTRALRRGGGGRGAGARRTGRPQGPVGRYPAPRRKPAPAARYRDAESRGARRLPARVLAAAQRHAPQARILGVLVQSMAPPGREVILGISNDPQWGPMLMVGLGGILVEALDDTAFAPVPLDHDQARALIARLKGARLFAAFRGAPAADVDALAELMVNLARFAHDHADTDRRDRSQPDPGASARGLGRRCADRAARRGCAGA